MSLGGKGRGCDPEDLLLENPGVEACRDGFVEDAHSFVKQFLKYRIRLVRIDRYIERN